MRYSLWSRDRLAGYTALDIHTVTPTLRQGFIEPTSEGRSILVDATAEWRALAEVKRGKRARGTAGVNDDALVMASMQGRKGLELELRDEQGALFDYEFLRVTDLFDIENGVVEEMCDTEEE